MPRSRLNTITLFAAATAAILPACSAAPCAEDGASASGDDSSGLSGATCGSTVRAWQLYEVQLMLAMIRNGIPFENGAISNEGARTAARTYQAEGSLLGGAVERTAKFAGYQASGYVAFEQAGGFVQVPVDVVVSDTHTIAVRYANGDLQNRALEVKVDGVAVATLSAPATGGWGTWKTESVNVYLSAGKHTVRFTQIGDEGPNLDTVTFTRKSGPIETDNLVDCKSLTTLTLNEAYASRDRGYRVRGLLEAISADSTALTKIKAHLCKLTGADDRPTSGTLTFEGSECSGALQPSESGRSVRLERYYFTQREKEEYESLRVYRKIAGRDNPFVPASTMKAIDGGSITELDPITSPDGFGASRTSGSCSSYTAAPISADPYDGRFYASGECDPLTGSRCVACNLDGETGCSSRVVWRRLGSNGGWRCRAL